MRPNRKNPLPLVPLLQTYREAGILPVASLAEVPVLGKRFQEILIAQEKFLNESFLAGATESEFTGHLLKFQNQCSPLPCQPSLIEKKTSLLRHALTHLVRCEDPIPQKIERVLSPHGTYFIPNLDLAFWSAILQALEPAYFPACLPSVWKGLHRLGSVSASPPQNPAKLFFILLECYQKLLGQFSFLSALHLDHFLSLVAGMQGRDLWSGISRLSQECKATNSHSELNGLPDNSARENRPHFSGFCSDTFRFLADLQHNNKRDWMEQNRERYHFFLREPLVELCQSLADRYVEPILNGKWKLNLETTVRTGKTLSSICKNDYGKTQPYHKDMWITFCRGQPGNKKQDVQLFVRVSEQRLNIGLGFGPQSQEVLKLFRNNVQGHSTLLLYSLEKSGARAHCQFALDVDFSRVAEVESPENLVTWSQEKTPYAGISLSQESPLLRNDDLVGEVILTLDRLLPLYFCSIQAEPHKVLQDHFGLHSFHPTFATADFLSQSLLSSTWLEKAKTLLEMKRQLILQGVPGTGKTFVARQLARWLTSGEEDNIRLVQFHPTFSYEEFVEGIKAKTVKVKNRHDVTYQVQDGVLCDFAAQAWKNPGQNFVLVLDELNRGNLPRIFGELLYLLEYRHHKVILPYSRREFQLPANLYFLATMNAADRSVSLLDQALRRRFSFLEMPPDKDLLSNWLRRHSPSTPESFRDTVVELFEELNSKLSQELGRPFQIGHSYFMVPELDENKLQTIWTHQIFPLLEDYFVGQPNRLAAFDLEKLLQGRGKKSAGLGKKLSCIR